MSDNPYGNSFSGYGAQTSGPAGQTVGNAQPQAPAAPASPGLEGFADLGGGAAQADLVKDTTTANFSADVIQESRRQPVIVDFWAPWCGPCKQLTPIIERAVKAAGGKVKLVKMNIDDHPAIAGQLGVQSIPAVFAFVDGQPVDGFMGALPESEVKAFIDRLPKGKGGGADDPVAQALEQARQLLADGDAGGAAQLFGAVLQHEPNHAAATAGLGECYLAAGDTARAKALVDGYAAEDAGKPEDPALAAIRTKLKLAEEISELGDPVALQARIECDPDDHQARYDLALIAQAKGERATAAGHLLEIIGRDRTFEDDAARKKLLEFFEAWGPTDPATKEARRKLSSLLFT
ncbi:thioredoxin [Aurantimonas sp. C2-6-R+9]|uniref:thioredoxin n=1 Tax=unclassified Aurantimonas TaxID=2638230 RepID=UPI002E197CEC|nr:MULTISPECIES: thioredoxin [unclassified Aurantimonas]MEC5289790.1 thioredoxin [Aurantimonas sp. C2-3-R2]MEC5379757.1 thioredoxin [Aurantimonas sp. C2-6-R+9]MEC5410771.1 thioredoxin [Aurantimonas sp. C2-4-R8]